MTRWKTPAREMQGTQAMNTSYKGPFVAIKLNAGNDRNGNPRRCWLVYDAPTGDLIGARDEGYDGLVPLIDVFPDVVELGTFNVKPSEYQKALYHAPLK
jgi:hypothetical protein